MTPTVTPPSPARRRDAPRRPRRDLLAAAPRAAAELAAAGVVIDGRVVAPSSPEGLSAAAQRELVVAYRGARGRDPDAARELLAALLAGVDAELRTLADVLTGNSQLARERVDDAHAALRVAVARGAAGTSPLPPDDRDDGDVLPGDVERVGGRAVRVGSPQWRRARADRARRQAARDAYDPARGSVLGWLRGGAARQVMTQFYVDCGAASDNEADRDFHQLVKRARARLAADGVGDPPPDVLAAAALEERRRAHVDRSASRHPDLSDAQRWERAAAATRRSGLDAAAERYVRGESAPSLVSLDAPWQRQGGDGDADGTLGDVVADPQPTTPPSRLRAAAFLEAVWGRAGGDGDAAARMACAPHWQWVWLRDDWRAQCDPAPEVADGDAAPAASAATPAAAPR